MAEQRFNKVVLESDPGCVAVSDFKITSREAENVFGTDYFVYKYKASIKSLSDCLTLNSRPLAQQAVSGFYGAENKDRFKDKWTYGYKELKPNEIFAVEGKITYTKTVEGWTAN